MALRAADGPIDAPAPMHGDGDEGGFLEASQPAGVIRGSDESEATASSQPVQAANVNAPGAAQSSSVAGGSPGSPGTPSSPGHPIGDASASSRGASSGSHSRQDGGKLGQSLSPGWLEATPSRSFGTVTGGRTPSALGSPQTPGSPLMLPISDPELGEGTAGFETATRFTPGCQGTHCPSSCCSPEGVCLVDLLHAVEGAAASPRDFLSPRSPLGTRGSLPASQQQQQQQVAQQQQLQQQLHQQQLQQQQQQQQPHFHPERGPSATALAPGKCPGSTALRGSSIRAGSSWVLQSNTADEKETSEEGESARGSEALASRKGREGRAVRADGDSPRGTIDASVMEGGQTEEPKDAGRDPFEHGVQEEQPEVGTAAAAASETAVKNDQLTGRRKEGDTKPDSVDNQSDTTEEEGGKGGPCSSEEEPKHQLDIAEEHRASDGRQQELQELQEQQPRAAVVEQEAPIQQKATETEEARDPWLDDLLTYKCVQTPIEEDPWEVTYEAFVRSRMMARRQEVAEAVLREAHEHDAAAEAPAASFGQSATSPLQNACGASFSSASAAPANAGSQLPSHSTSIGIQGRPQEHGAEWNRALGSNHPVTLPQGSDLVTYVQTESGERQEQHAVYSRETGVYEQGKMNFRDLFGFIRWVHTEGGGPFPWESLQNSATTEQNDQVPQEDVDAEIDIAFDPDAPSEKTVISDIDFHRNEGFPWNESIREGNTRGDGNPAASTEAGNAAAEGHSGWPVVDNYSGTDSPNDEQPWWNLETDIFSS